MIHAIVTHLIASSVGALIGFFLFALFRMSGDE